MEIGLKSKQRKSIRKSFSSLVRSKRNTLDISQEELSFRSGLHRTYVGSVERGERNLSLENIYLLATTLECDPQDLLLSLENMIKLSNQSHSKH